MVGGRQANYQYVKLAEAKDGGETKTCNVFGVVTFVKVPKKTRGTDYCMTLSITDESLEKGDRIVCNLFFRSLKSFPSVNVGDIVRFHRLVVEHVFSDPKGKPGHGFAWLVVSDDADKPVASSGTFTYTDENKKRVQELQAWARQQNHIKSAHTTIATLKPRDYCDLACQIIGTYVEQEGVCFVARVWDGTQPPFTRVNTDNELDQVDTELESRASDLWVDVWLYDDHFETCTKMKPGQYIKLCNLHAAISKDTAVVNQDSNADPVIEYTIHGGTAYGRGVVYLDPQSPEVAALKQRLDAVAVAPPSENSSRTEHSGARKRTAAEEVNNPQPGCSKDDAPSPQKSSCTTSARDGTASVELKLSGCEEGNTKKVSRAEEEASESGGGDVVMSLASSTEECMLQTASVIIGHQHIGRTPLSAVQSHKVPYKFRVLANLVDFYPNTDDSAQFVQLVCPKCCYLQKHSADCSNNTSVTKASSVSSLTSVTSKLARFLGGGFANWNHDESIRNKEERTCPQCSCSSGGEQVPLEPMYMLRLLLQDSSGHLVANLWRKEAVTFFRGLKPDAILKDSGHFRDIVSTLRSLCLSRHSSSSSAAIPPKLDCCLASYNAQSGVNFHIFDTELV